MGKESYKRLGDYIVSVKNKNKDLKATKLLGINIDKFFMPSVANVIGTDMSRYKVVSKYQFACNRMHVGRDYRIPVALSKADEVFMVSPAYDVFEIVDANILNPEYLMMWFSRKEFDRNAWFYTDADVRGGLSWKSLCDMQLPIPTIEKQQAIVKEYNTIVNRIKLNEQLNKKLEDTAQTLYKHWFVDFEFPNEDGKPYKSSGGKMVFNEELEKEIPEEWDNCILGDLVNTQYGYTASADYEVIGPKFLRITDIVQNHINWAKVPNCAITDNDFKKYSVKNGDILVARTGATVGYAKRINKNHPKAIFASYLVRVISKDNNYSVFIGLSVVSEQFKKYILSVAGGSAQPQANAILMSEFKLIKPKSSIVSKLNKLIIPLFDEIENLSIEIGKLVELKDLILSKMTKI